MTWCSWQDASPWHDSTEIARVDQGCTSHPRSCRPAHRMRGEAVTVRQMLEAHPRAATEDREVLARCVEACAECATACTICADADLAEADAPDMMLCARLDLDCADSCVAA